MSKKQNTKTEVPAVVEDMVPARIDESELAKARTVTETQIRYLRNTPGGLVYEGKVLPNGVVGKPRSLKTEWVQFVDDQKITDEFSGDLQDRPGPGFKVRAELVLLTPDKYLVAVGFPETSYTHNLTPFLTEIEKDGLQFSDLLVRIWCEKRTGRDRTYPSVKIEQVAEQGGDRGN
jgi:hypothetical protein